MIFLYRLLTTVASPFVPFLLRKRLERGKEDAVRLQERLGYSSVPRPEGKLLWVHAASVGEANAALTLIQKLLAQHPTLHVLLTTVTVTSAALMQRRLPERASHQFVPVDTLPAVKRFLQHWKPDVALWVDSEFWPNLILETHRTGAVMGIINARMSLKSFESWRFAKSFIHELLACFILCFAQSTEDAQRLQDLGVATITGVGNLKYNAPPLPYDEQELATLTTQIGGRPVWLAASTHSGEEKIIAFVHQTLQSKGSNLLTIIVPRHAKRGDEITAQLSPLYVARRTLHEQIGPTTDVYLADTMGELGLFYRLAPVVFIGGSLVPHGGQNPLEAAQLGCAIMMGPHMENFTAVVDAMEKDKACLRVANTAELVRAVAKLLDTQQTATRLQLTSAAHKHVQAQSGQVEHITNELRPYLA